LGFLHFTLQTWAAVSFLGLFGTALGFTFFYRGILSLGPHKAGAYITLVPFFGLLSGALLLGESAGPSVFAGLFISLAGLALIQKY
jgi:drug/metabolite transporter (DMT)-like permease